MSKIHMTQPTQLKLDGVEYDFYFYFNYMGEARLGVAPMGVLPAPEFPGAARRIQKEQFSARFAIQEDSHKVSILTEETDFSLAMAQGIARVMGELNRIDYRVVSELTELPKVATLHQREGVAVMTASDLKVAAAYADERAKEIEF